MGRTSAWASSVIQQENTSSGTKGNAMLMSKENLNAAFTALEKLQDQTSGSGSRVVLKARQMQLSIAYASLVLAAQEDGHLVETINGHTVVVSG